MEPIDPDVDPRYPTRQGPVVAAVALGGAVGACARYGTTLLWPTPPTGFPWTTLAINTTGCALLGVVLVLLTEGEPRHHLIRPFVGTGVIGGYTTFSTFAVDLQRLLQHHRATTALGYLAATVAAGLLAVLLAVTATRSLRARTS
ncbi:CrcB family protein [Actinosynnema sp. NPDC020468]|uniref:fluoride efflux transporter FluC n=1 Tax=Actinosynnema sp. NPDC020468 TaxID=3154488 RepID=UPI0033F518F2